MDLEQYVKERVALAKKASIDIAQLSSHAKNYFLETLQVTLKEREEQVLLENQIDVLRGEQKGLSAAMLDRLRLTPARLDDLLHAIEEVTHLSDPVGKTVTHLTRPNGLDVQRVRIPLGVIAMIYESRPNVTIDAAILCFKAGNAVVLRGGSEAIHSNRALAAVLKEASIRAGITPDWVQLIEITDRETVAILSRQVGGIDLIIPRGGDSLMKLIDAHARVPVLKHDKGVCSLYIDDEADLEMAIALAVNAKVSRPGVCNALENIWVHEKLLKPFIPKLVAVLRDKGVLVKGDAGVRQVVPDVERATDLDWTTEYLDLIISIGIVRDIDEAILRIRNTSSLHTESIVTENALKAEQFLNALHASCVMWNASTRFNDGGQLGLGAEIGISTTKLHAFGPMGLEELTTTKFVVRGKGQTRA